MYCANQTEFITEKGYYCNMFLTALHVCLHGCVLPLHPCRCGTIWDLGFKLAIGKPNSSALVMFRVGGSVNQQSELILLAKYVYRHTMNLTLFFCTEYTVYY